MENLKLGQRVYIMNVRQTATITVIASIYISHPPSVVHRYYTIEITWANGQGPVDGTRGYGITHKPHDVSGFSTMNRVLSVCLVISIV